MTSDIPKLLRNISRDCAKLADELEAVQAFPAFAKQAKKTLDKMGCFPENGVWRLNFERVKDFYVPTLSPIFLNVTVYESKNNCIPTSESQIIIDQQFRRWFLVTTETSRLPFTPYKAQALAESPSGKRYRLYGIFPVSAPSSTDFSFVLSVDKFELLT